MTVNVREKLVELLKTTPTRNGYTDLGDIADHLIANGVTVQEWIPVTARLPDFGSLVIACGEKGGVFIVKSDGMTIGFGRMDGTSKYRSFTHWMPFPPLPKEDI